MGMKDGLAHVPAIDSAPWVVRFGSDPHSWNLDRGEFEDGDDVEPEGDGSGMPGRQLVADALQTFAEGWRDYDAETAARVFHLPIALIADIAVDVRQAPDHPSEISTIDLGGAIMVLTGCISETGRSSVAAMAELLNQHPTRIIEAVGASHWMFLSGDRDSFADLFIEQDGE